MKWKWPRKGKCEGGVHSRFSQRKGSSIWAFNAKIKPKDRAERIGSPPLFQSPGGTALFCFSTTDPCDLLCRSVTEKRGVRKNKNSSDDRGLLLRNFLYLAFPSFPVLFALFFFLSFPSGKYSTLSVNKGRMKKGVVKSLLIPHVRGDV